MATQLSGQMDLGSATETIALASTTDVASFTDNNLADTASAFTATIDWGDGTTTAGAVVGSNGSFTVEGGHTYADEGFPLATVNVTRTADNTQLAMLGTVAVDDDDNLSGIGKTFAFTPNQPLTNVTVATFTDTNHVNGADDFVASIDWGDGTTSAGTVSGGSGTFTVSGSHTYAASGDNTVTVFLNDDSPDAAFASATSTAVSGFAGQVNLATATEGTALTNVEVASFADTTANLPAGDYTATVDWGDGTTTAGAVSGSNGTFTVTGSHTYADEGDDVAAVTITRTTDNTTVTATGTIAVLEGDLLTAQPRTFGGQPGQPIGNVVVATFADIFTGNVPSDFTATIDWGDGTSSTGTVSGGGGTFSVSGSHTYAAAGQDTLSVTLTDDPPGFATATANSTAVIGFSGDVVLTDASEDVALPNNTPVATFTDGNLSDTAASFTATIDWGDGTTTAVAVAGSNGSFTIEGGHTYADEGTAPLVATVTRTSDNAQLVESGDVAIADTDVLTGHARTINGSPGQALTNVTVATFTDANTINPASDFTATIDWGDGTTTAGTVSGSGGTFSVAGTHTYANAGQDTVTVTLADDAPGTATASITSAAIIGFSGDVVLTDASEDVALPNNTPVATFTEGNLSDTAASFTATIDWGDGTTTAGAVAGSNGSFTIEGGHTYADEGTAPLVATVTRTSDNAQLVESGDVAIADTDVLTGHARTINGSPGQALTNVTVATFTDANTINPASDFTATIDWGDGTTTAGTVSGSGGTFSVAGTHTYANAGQDTVTVTLADDAPGTATASITSAANIGFSGTVVLQSATEDVALSGVAVATFTDNSGDPASDFVAQIDWGDGTTTAGAVSGASGSFTVTGSHTYADEGNEPLVATVIRVPDVVQIVLGGTVVVADDDVLTGHGVAPISVNAQQPLTNVTVATFTDTDTVNVAGDFTASIDWGDGTATTGTISGGSGSFSVAGSHTYASGVQDTITVTMADDAPGTATATATTAVNIAGGSVVKNDFDGNHVSDIIFQDTAAAPIISGRNHIGGDANSGVPLIDFMSNGTVASSATLPSPTIAWHIVGSGDFNSDSKSDILFQSTDGTPMIWTMNGPAITSQTVLSDPGASWRAVGSGDFNGDNKSDILFQNSDGTPMIWTMNGTSVSGTATLSDPGAAWRLVGTGDFNNDRKSDLVFQNSDGTPMIWLMNGTSVTATVTLADPGAAWRLIGTGDFNKDGVSDLLFQNNDGTPMIWTMNGTSVAATTTLPNPGAAFRAVGTGDYDGDGRSDILFQSAVDGTPLVWTMNNTTITAQNTLANPGGAAWHANTG